MTARLALPLLLLLVGPYAQAQQERPPGVPEPTNERCLGCHDDPELTNDTGASMTVHAGDLAGGAHKNVPCADCHTSAHEVRHPRNKLGPVSLQACAKCHAADVQALPESVHAKLVEGPLGPATCVACHDSIHTVLNRAHAASPAHPSNQSKSCGSCHRVARRQFDNSAHAQALAGGNRDAPSCAGCHSAHDVHPVADVGWRLKLSNEECGDCHEARGASFRDNFHGQMAHLGFGGAAFCADCHRAHDILPASNPESSVAPANLVQTCGRCHEQANANFVKYHPHANPHARDESMVLWSTMLFMKLLILGVFAFFGLHSLMWFVRSVLERNRQ
jgi:hypothetical protein